MAPRKKTLNAKKALEEADAARADKAGDTTLLMPPTKTLKTSHARSAGRRSG